MKIYEKYHAMIAELGRLQVEFSAVTARLGSAQAAQRAVDHVGINLIEFEQRHGITEARELLRHETVMDDLPMFERLLQENSQSVDWPAEIAAGRIARDDVEDKIAARAQIVTEAKKSIATLNRLRKEANDRRKKIPAEILTLAGERDPLGRDERNTFTRLHADTRVERITNEVLMDILAPLPA